MSDKLFTILMIAVVCAGVISLTSLIIYTAVLQKDASIISYIASGR